MHPTPQESRHTRSGLPAASARVRERLLSMRSQLSQARLDKELAAGMPPDSNPLLRERARHLVSRDSRLKLALGLGQALHQQERPGLHTAQVPVNSEAVDAASPVLEMLAERLRGFLPIGAQGAAKTKILLTDGSGPLYNPGSGSDLKTAAHRALAALETDWGRRQSTRGGSRFGPIRDSAAR